MVSAPESGETDLRIAVVMPTYNRWGKTHTSLASLLNSEYRNFEVVLVEDGCTDGTVEQCQAEFPEVTILHGNGDLWWSGSANMGIEYAISHGADAVILLNDDNNVEPLTIGSFVESFKRQGPESIICGRIKVLGSDATEWRGNPPPWHPEFNTWQPLEFNGRAELSIDHPPGRQGVLIPTECFRRVGTLDRKNFAMNWADHNFHYRAMKGGYRYFIAADAVIWNAPKEEPPQARDIFTLSGAWWFLTNRRSYGNLKALRRHLKRYLPPGEYRRTFYPILGRHLLWLGYGWLTTKPALHKPLRAIKRAVSPNIAPGGSTR
jgi:GT2 family glycosyltransferase